MIWPADTSWDEENQVVMPPAGEPLSIGQSVDGDGGYMASGAVEGFAGPRARDLAERCLVDEGSDQVAVLNNSPTAIAASGP